MSCQQVDEIPKHSNDLFGAKESYLLKYKQLKITRIMLEYLVNNYVFVL